MLSSRLQTQKSSKHIAVPWTQGEDHRHINNLSFENLEPMCDRRTKDVQHLFLLWVYPAPPTLISSTRCV